MSVERNPSMHPRFTRLQALAAYGGFALLIAVVFWPLSLDYAFYYSDAPRHALNGAFILDLLTDMPLHDPVQWAYDYYAQYPALTILFYPPLYPAVLALAYALLGVSQLSAVIVDALFLWALAIGVMHLARRATGPTAAIAAGALAVVAPEIVFWSRQIMTDVPAVAVATWSAVLLLRYIETDRSRWLYWAVVAVVSAMWLKITLCFMAAVFVITLAGAERGRLWKRPRYYAAAVLALIGVIPLIWLTLKFGQTNVASVSGVPDGATSRASLANWLWYGARIPEQLGWPLTAMILLGLALGACRVWQGRRLAPVAILGLAWVGVGYLFFSVIDLKDARFSLPILVPLIVLAVFGIQRLPRWRFDARPVLLSLAVVATLAVTLIQRPPLQVIGYARIVKDIAREAPPQTNVVFSGYRDGAFIFAMRAIGHRDDLNTVRADKILLHVAIRRETGVTQNDLSKAEIGQRLTRLKAAYVVAQDGFWDDLAVMRRFSDVLHSDQFEPVAHYRLKANFPASDRRITVYRNRARLPDKRPPLSIDLPAIDRTVSEQ